LIEHFRGKLRQLIFGEKDDLVGKTRESKARFSKLKKRGTNYESYVKFWNVKSTIKEEAEGCGKDFAV